MKLGHRFPEMWPLKVSTALRLRTCTHFGHRIEAGPRCTRCTLLFKEEPTGMNAIKVIWREDCAPVFADTFFKEDPLIKYIRRHA